MIIFFGVIIIGVLIVTVFFSRNEKETMERLVDTMEESNRKRRSEEIEPEKNTGSKKESIGAQRPTKHWGKH